MASRPPRVRCTPRPRAGDAALRRRQPREHARARQRRRSRPRRAALAGDGVGRVGVHRARRLGDGRGHPRDVIGTLFFATAASSISPSRVGIAAGVVGLAACGLYLARRRLSGKARHVLDVVRGLVAEPLAAVEMVGWVAACTAATILASACVAAALGVTHPLAAALVIVPAIELAKLLPITPGNVGLTSAAVAFALHAHGVPLEAAVAAGITLHAVETVVGLSLRRRRHGLARACIPAPPASARVAPAPRRVGPPGAAPVAVLAAGIAVWASACSACGPSRARLGGRQPENCDARPRIACWYWSGVSAGCGSGVAACSAARRARVRDDAARTPARRRGSRPRRARSSRRAPRCPPGRRPPAARPPPARARGAPPRGASRGSAPRRAASRRAGDRHDRRETTVPGLQRDRPLEEPARPRQGSSPQRLLGHRPRRSRCCSKIASTSAAFVGKRRRACRCRPGARLRSRPWRVEPVLGEGVFGRLENPAAVLLGVAPEGTAWKE